MIIFRFPIYCCTSSNCNALTYGVVNGHVKLLAIPFQDQVPPIGSRLLQLELERETQAASVAETLVAEHVRRRIEPNVLARIVDELGLVAGLHRLRDAAVPAGGRPQHRWVIAI